MFKNHILLRETCEISTTIKNTRVSCLTNETNDTHTKLNIYFKIKAIFIVAEIEVKITQPPI